MTDRLMKRIAAIEQRRAPTRGGVIHQLPDETPEEAAQRAIAAGRVGPFVLMPAPVSAEAWQASAVASQVRLKQRAEVFLRTGEDPDTMH